jgi:hypothetical protein
MTQIEVLSVTPRIDGDVYAGTVAKPDEVRSAGLPEGCTPNDEKCIEGRVYVCVWMGGATRWIRTNKPCPNPCP